MSEKDKSKESPQEQKVEENNENEKKDDKEMFSGKKISKDKYDEICAQLEKEKADKEHWKNEYYRAYADTQNLRKSLEEENRVAIRYRSEGFLSELLPALDAFHMALENPPQSEETSKYLVGFKYIYNQLVKTLTDEGVSELSPKIGDEFDLNYMHAIDSLVDENAKPGTVIKVFSKGYKLHDRLIRPAMVAVAKAKEEVKEDEPKKEESETKEAAKA